MFNLSIDQLNTLGQREKQAVGQKNIAGLTNMAGSFGSSLLGIGGAMMGNLQRQSENQSLDYLAYQNDMQNSMQDVNRGGGLQLLMMGGKVKPRKYPQGGVVGGEMPQPVQTEVKEKIITQDGSIFDTKATKKHKDMKSSEITDVLPADSYVISNRIMLKKSKAEKIVLGLQPLLYKEGGDKSKYKEFRLSDIFTKDEETLSELTDTLRKRFPTELSDLQKGNIFARKTSEENKSARSMILGELIRLNEEGKPKKSNNTEVAQFPGGGLAGSYQGGFPTNYINNLVKNTAPYQKTNLLLDPVQYPTNNVLPSNSFQQFGIDPDNKVQRPNGIINGQYISSNNLNPYGPPSSIMDVTNQFNLQNPNYLRQVSSNVNSINKSFNPTQTAFNNMGNAYSNMFTQGMNGFNQMKPFVPGLNNSMGSTNQTQSQGNNDQNDQGNNEYDSLIKYTQGQMDGLDGDFRRNARDNTNAFMSNVGGVLGGSMTAMAGILGQNPRVEAPNLKTPDLPRQMDKSYFDYLAYQNNKNTNAVANAALSNTSDYSKAMNYITAAGGKAMEANSQLGAQAAQINLGLESQYQQAKNQVQNQQAMLDVNAKNETNKFINNLVGQSAGIGTNAINNIAALNNQRINYNAKNRSEKTSRYSTLINQMMMLRQLQKGMPISFGATTATATQ